MACCLTGDGEARQTLAVAIAMLGAARGGGLLICWVVLQFGYSDRISNFLTDGLVTPTSFRPDFRPPKP